ncbi:hypothetical protein Ahy_A07g035869 [Arachis hypogaea]|uniref:Protein FAR1-RELATED SEQUENCE n=1 Tax=Arachis hypogaea TaxID=3818 RepID=A0A445CEN6_ARAHY|nr:hypothetical protein Ahy_A07g035869 [Arachis hypogaea]
MPWKGDEIKNQLIICSREERWKSKISRNLKTNFSARINCPTRIYVHILKDVGLWTIFKVVLNYSHPCCPDRVEILKQYRELSIFVRRTIETNEEAGIKPNKTYQSFVAAASSHWDLSFIEKNVRNYITREVRNVSEQDDAKEFGKYLLRMKEKNQNFLFELNLEGDHSIKNAFWADARSKAACKYFGDVVSFDTTYNTNRYNLVFSSFVGVNHHELYEDRHIWIPVYLDHHFWAEMRSTQRNKSMHAIFNKFITCNSSLSQFVKQYDNCLASREQREREFDVVDFHTVIPCATKSEIEAQFQHVYTHEKFREVQGQFRGKVNCITRSMHSTLGFTTYEIVGQFEELTRILHRVFDNVMAEMQEYQAKSNGKSLFSHEEATLSNVNDLQSPPHVRTRGHPKNRLRSNLEKKISNATKKKKKPAPSELNLLDGGSTI